jgi:S1-C subfamily serine protease
MLKDLSGKKMVRQSQHPGRNLAGCRRSIALLTFAICLLPNLVVAAKPTLSDIQKGTYRPAYQPAKSLPNSQLRSRLSSYRSGDSQQLASRVLSRSFGDALDYYYLAHAARNLGWRSTSRTYARLAAINFAAQLGKGTEELYQLMDFPKGCGRIPIEYCPSESLGRSIVELNAALDAVDASEANATALSVPDTIPSSSIFTDRNGRNLLHWYPNGRKIWVIIEANTSARFMTLDVPLNSPDIAVPRFTRSDLVRVSTPDSSWSVFIKTPDALPSIFSYQGAVYEANAQIESVRTQRLQLTRSESIPSVLDFYQRQSENLADLRSLIEPWQSNSPFNQESKEKLLLAISEEESILSKESSSILAAAGDTERSLDDILEIERYLRRSGRNERLLELECVGVADVCENIRLALKIDAKSEVSRPYTLFVATGRERKSQSIIGQESVRSAYVVGTQQVRNPIHQTLQVEYQNALLAVEAARAEKSRADYNAAVNPGFVTSYVQGAALGTLLRAQGRVEEISRALSQTPPLVSEERLSPYDYSENRVKALYQRQYGLLLHSKKTTRTRVSTVSVEEERVFTLATGRSDSDKTQRTYSTEADIASWLDNGRSLTERDFRKANWVNSVVSVKNGKRDYAGTARRLVSVGGDDLLPGRQAAIGRSGEIDAASNDPRLESVVLVRTKASVGAGFFIGKRNILTNAHVVGAEASVEIKLSDGRKTTGRVIAVDDARDLALLRIDIDGKPSTFIADAGQIRAGVAVLVIGHPQGLEFSVSRGVVSAVRRGFTPAGGIDVIQTDSAINPGNSGGPLFLGNSVIGIVTFKRGLSEGLGFAVHRDEIQAFLREAFTQ